MTHNQVWYVISDNVWSIAGPQNTIRSFFDLQAPHESQNIITSGFDVKYINI